MMDGGNRNDSRAAATKPVAPSVRDALSNEKNASKSRSEKDTTPC